MTIRRLMSCVAVASAAVLACLCTAKAETVEQFYKGKTIHVIIGYGPGGGYPPGGPGQLTYLQGAPVGFADAIQGAMTNIVTLRGRASRSAFWWFALLQLIVYTVISWISDWSTAAGVVLDIIIGIPLIVAGIALAVRRLHDTNRTGWWWWIGWVPFFGWIVLLVFYLMRGTPGPNRYSVAG